MHFIITGGKVYRVGIFAVCSEKDDGFSGVIFVANNGKKFRLPFEKFSFLIPAEKDRNKY